MVTLVNGNISQWLPLTKRVQYSRMRDNRKNKTISTLLITKVYNELSRERESDLMTSYEKGSCIAPQGQLPYH